MKGIGDKIVATKEIATLVTKDLATLVTKQMTTLATRLLYAWIQPTVVSLLSENANYLSLTMVVNTGVSHLGCC